ncbi:MAG: ABC transporter ATP-binding protein/permease [Treponema sp.]|nr:ABC transporter ATP-binding protein/permease [Treponema sp.]
MADYFETDNVTRDYDSHLVKRILFYLKPYTFLVISTLVALVISTLGELYIPVLQQQVIDDAILPRFLCVKNVTAEDTEDSQSTQIRKEIQELPFSSVVLSFGSQAALEELYSSKSAMRIGDRLFIKQNQRLKIPAGAEAELKTAGILEDESWYAFSIPADSSARGILALYPGFFINDGNTAAIRNGDLSTLSAKEIAAVRYADIAAIKKAVLIFLAALLLVFLFTFSQTWTTNLMSQKVMKDMRLSLFKKTASQSTAFLSRHPVGRIVTRLTGDVETINEFFTSVLVAFLKDLSIMAGVLVTMFILSPKMAIALIITLPPVLVLTMISRRKARDAFRQQRIASSKVFAYLAERLAGVQVVQLFTGEKKSGREFAGRNRELLDAKLGEMYVFATFRPIVEWFGTFSAAVIIAVGANMALSLSLSLGVLIAFINLAQMFFSPVTDIAEKYTLLQSAMAGSERVFKLLDTDEYIPDTGSHPVEGMVRGHIEFDDVHFSYKRGEEVIKGLSFTVNPGETAAIVGYTGAGKTTITNILARLWDVDSGIIRLDGVPIKDFPLAELRRSVLPVLQDVFLFSGTVAENISLGLPLREEEIVEAARAVYAHDFILRLPDGYKTVLSEGAANISSGQRQLLSFARVIAHNPAIVVLDEATSSIDTETEHLIQMGMQKVLSGRTSIVIAHRLSTIKNASRILVLHDGRLAEEGKHEELIKANGLYAGLYRLQYINS